MNIMEQSLFGAAYVGDAARVHEVLREHGEVDVNWASPTQHSWTALHIACFHGSAEVVQLLLRCPGIAVNQLDVYGYSPFYRACLNGRVDVVRALLQDRRVDIGLVDRHGRLPLWRATYYGYCEVITWMLVLRGSELDLTRKGQDHLQGTKDYSVIEIAASEHKQDVVALLQRFEEDRDLTIHQLQVQLNLPVARAAGLFANIIFVCDDLLQVTKASTPESATKPLKASSATATDVAEEAAEDAARFYAIALKLPMELQMILCHKVYRSQLENIRTRDSEQAFRSLARTLGSAP